MDQITFEKEIKGFPRPPPPQPKMSLHLAHFPSNSDVTAFE